MLEIKNVTKKYVTKGVSVTALNNVSVTFPEKGMVFLLGKSGSGKSTLLNVAGGLDKPDSGDVILNGRYSRDFTGGDFNSYRNTFIGFIFQDFNVLNEYSVEENVSLALELQGKRSDKAKVEEILKKVDLEGYGNRRPNTLSGGQKQRVAIARALVKNPEIIMADEPTGALDSVTGKQVFDTLKKLSEEKLVIVVSHDRSFAQRYADRIIELKDGVIVSDRIRRDPSAEKKAAFSEGNTLYIIPDEPLSSEDIARANSFFSSPVKEKRALVQNADEDFIPAVNVAPDVCAEGDDGQVKFIRSHLPIKYAAKMGVSGLKVKPIRLAFAVFLSVVAFVVFGLLATLVTFNRKSVVSEALKSGECVAAMASLSVPVEQYNSAYGYMPATHNFSYAVTDKYISDFNSEYAAKAVGIYTYGNYEGYYTLKNNMADPSVKNMSLYYSSNIDLGGFCNMEGKDLSEYSLKLVAGEYPTGEDEIAITVYQFDMLRAAGFIPVAGAENTEHLSPKELSSYSDILGSYISVCKYESSIYLNAKVVGVIDCGAFPSEYEVLKKMQSSNMYWLQTNTENGYTASQLTALHNRISDYYENSFNSVIFVGNSFYDAHTSHIGTEMNVKENILNLIKIYDNFGGGTLEEIFSEVVCTHSAYNANSSVYDGHSRYVTDFNFSSNNEDGVYNKILIPFNGSSSVIKAAVDKIYDCEEGISYNVNNSVLDDVTEAQQTVNQIKYIIFAAAVGLALFAALMLGSVISASVNDKQKNIGVLRAIGAGGRDIFKIFFTEALIITLSCFVISVAGALIACNIVNAALVGAYVTTLSLFVFVPLNALMMFAVAVLFALAATVIPVRKTVKKKPVEAIRCL